jgi:hypothetical protein
MLGTRGTTGSSTPAQLTRVERWTWRGTDVTVAILAYPFVVVAAALWFDRDRERPWWSTLHVARGLQPDTASFDLGTPTWRSAAYAGAERPLEALVVRMALLGQAVDVAPLAAALLPPDAQVDRLCPGVRPDARAIIQLPDY